MPLLSSKLYILNKIRKDKKDEEATFCHSLTNEICQNQEEINRKTYLYSQKIWTCRITGQINLTFKEALKSEQDCAKMIKTSFKKCFEASVLQFVHHSKESLDTLIHKAWTQIHQEFCVNEPVTIKLTAPKEMTLKGVIVKVDRSKSSEDKDQDNSPTKLNSDASSSDKENKKKIIPVKKNYFYSVKIFEMDKLVKDVPAETIDRTLRPPSKDQIRMFIRAHAIRHSGRQTYPWVVDDDLVKKYKLPVLEPEFVADKAKMKELSRVTEVQVYNKMRDEANQKNGEALVDLTKSDDEDEPKRPTAAKKTDSSNKDTKAANRKMKQSTLDCSITGVSQNGGTAPRATLRSPLSSPTRSLPPLAQRLVKLMKDSPHDPSVKQLIFKCCQLFSNQQISKFPDSIRTQIKDRKEKYEEKKRLDAMTPEQREAYMLARRNQLRQQLRERKREENAKLEDNEIAASKDIPEGNAVPVSDGMTQDQWARLVSISEFVRCYKRLLVPSPSGGDSIDDSKVIHVDELCGSVLGKSDRDHGVLAELVCVLLKTLLQENHVRNRREMGLALTELPVTPCTAGELLRLVLPLGRDKRPGGAVTTAAGHNGTDDITGDNGVGDMAVTEDFTGGGDNIGQQDDLTEENAAEMLANSNNNKIAGPICEQLEVKELHELSVEDKIAVLELLQSRILELDVVSSFIDEQQREVCEAYKRKVAETKDVNDKIKAVRTNKLNMSRVLMTGVALPAGSSPRNDESPLAGTVAVAGAGLDEASQVVRRRQSIEMKAKEIEEKEKRLEKERQYQKLEKEEQQFKRALEQCQKAYTTALSDAKQLMRVQPLGTDRFYRRYWHFPTSPAALYVETEVEEKEDERKDQQDAVTTTSTKWTMFTSAEEVQELLDSLCEKGVRESLLRAELEAVLPHLKDEMEVAAAVAATTLHTSPVTVAKGDKDDQDESFLVRGFKQELKETELSIRQGSLGGVEDYDEWTRCLDESSGANRAALKQALVAVFLGVHERFMNAPLKSSNGRGDFLAAVETAHTQGRLNVLQSFMDACVAWSKCAKDDKCRICRKSSDENAMLLCDSCNHAFHMFCLRPPLHEVPEGEWFCPHCKPVSRARDEGVQHQQHGDSAVANKDAKDAKDKQVKIKTRQGGAPMPLETCFVCRSRNTDQLAKCTSCKKCFHAQCHEPPLRQIRRTNWHCYECRQDEAATSSSHKTKHHNHLQYSRGTTKGSHGDSDNQDEQDEEEEDQDDNSEVPSEKETPKKPARKATKRSLHVTTDRKNGVVKRKKAAKEEVEPEKEEDDDNEEEENNEDKQDESSEDDSRKFSRPPTRKRSRLAHKPEVKKNDRRSKPVSDVDEDESDQDVDNLASLITKKRAGRKRNSVAADHSQEMNGSAHEERVAAKKSRSSLNGAKSPELIDKACHSMLKHLVNHKASWPFRDAVDPDEVPDYYQIITDPMDLAQMMHKQKNGAYRYGRSSLKQFIADIGQIFFNAEVYNLPDSKVMALAYTLEDFFRTIYGKYNFGVRYARMSE